MALEFLEYGGSESVDSKMPEGRGGWSPPQLGSYKMSIACHFGAASTQVGVGILIRDHEGLVVVAAGFVLQKYADQISNLAFAVFYALQLAYETGFRDSIVLEVLSRELMGLIHLDTPCLAPSGVVIEDIHAWRGFFSSIQFVFISNVCNKASYALATEAASSNLDQVWLEECPPCIIPFV